MLKEFKFVLGAIKRNALTPELEHYTIKDGRVTGFNGYMALSAPVPLDLEAKPKADTFYKALSACGESISLQMTPAGRLHIVSGGFKAFIPCIEHEGFEALPVGTLYPSPPGLLAAFKRMLPLISEDASRPWAMGLLVDRGTYTATNNVVIVQTWDGHQLPTFNCPRFAVAEVCRVGEEPTGIQIEGNSATFLYENGRWLRTQLLASEWPVETMNRILDRPNTQVPFPPSLAPALERLIPFIGSDWSPVFLREGALSTVLEDAAEEGFTIEAEGVPGGPIFNSKSLRLIAGEVETMDFSLYPQPCIFYGKGGFTRGAITGMQP